MRRLILLLIAIVVPAFICHADDEVRLSISDLKGALDFYERLTKHKMWIAYGVNIGAEVSIKFEGTHDEAKKAIRTALLEKNGIEVRDTDTETFVSYSEDPKYRDLRKRLEEVPATRVDGGRKVRVINSAEPK